MSSQGVYLGAIDYAQWFGHDWRFAQEQWLMTLWVLPVLILIVLYFSKRSARIQHRIADDKMLGVLVGDRRRWNTLAHVLVMTLALGMLIVGIAGPQSDPREVEVESRGRDVVFLVDVSRSMLARDVAPNRLEKSKLWINDLVDDLGNDRVGLVAFAGSSVVLSPLTTDRMFFRLALEELSPSSVVLGGTNIGDAIRKTMDMVFIDDELSDAGNFRDIVLISDGEDQESLPVEAARAAGARGVRIIAIGIGSNKGAPVPFDKDSTSPNSRGTQEVRSKLESGTLRSLAAASPGGVYLEVGTGTIDLAKVYQDLIASADQRTLESSSQTQYTERFMIFLAIAAGLMALDMLVIPDGNRRALA
jgi:Ca-activated chloride channel homolog